MRKEIFSGKIIEWYQANHRDLPWRKTREPYKIWLSEVILQQTRVAQGLPYYERFLRSFPTVFDLARAPENEVLRLWQGLGYYSRARNLHACARHVAKHCDGRFPESYEALRQLPGIGAYTAAAIASIAFLEPVAVVDGNVFRVLARIFGIEKDIAGNEGKSYFFLKANALIDTTRPDQFNQAVMEFGALQCLPRNPKCDDCIFSASCVANQKNMQAMLPIKLKKVKVRTRYFYYFIFTNGKKLMMKERVKRDIWRGLNDFYMMESTRKEKPEILMKTDPMLRKAKVIKTSRVYKHLLTHQKLMVQFIQVSSSMTGKQQLVMRQSGLRWLTLKKIEQVPKPILIARFLTEEYP